MYMKVHEATYVHSVHEALYLKLKSYYYPAFSILKKGKKFNPKTFWVSLYLPCISLMQCFWGSLMSSTGIKQNTLNIEYNVIYFTQKICHCRPSN